MIDDPEVPRPEGAIERRADEITLRDRIVMSGSLTTWGLTDIIEHEGKVLFSLDVGNDVIHDADMILWVVPGE